MPARIGVAAAYLAAGAAVFVIGPLIGTQQVPDILYQLVLGAWAVGLIVLPALGFARARRAALGVVLAIGAFLVVAAAVSGGLRSPFGA